MQLILFRLGSYTFKLSPKDELDFDFARSIAKLDTMGNPTYQDVGVSEKRLDFSGAFIGNDAWQQAETLEQMMDAGTPVALVYGPIHRTVRIENFTPKVKRFDYVLYDFQLLIIPTDYGFQSTQGSASTVLSSTPAPKSPPVSSTASIAQYADKTVVVKHNQTLWNMSQAEYGRGDLWPIIAKVNGIKHERAIQDGQKLKIPSKANVQKALDAFNNRINAVITAAGLSYLKSLEAKAN